METSIVVVVVVHLLFPHDFFQPDPEACRGEVGGAHELKYLVVIRLNSMNGDISRRESTTDEISKALVEAKTTLASKSYDFDEARLRARSAKAALEASHAAFSALAAERDRLAASRHHHSK